MSKRLEKRYKRKKDFYVPSIGDVVYIPPAYYLSHAIHDRHGGQSKVICVTIDDSDGICVWVEAFPHIKFDWQCLWERQEELQKRYGTKTAEACPDYSPEFNSWD